MTNTSLISFAEFQRFLSTLGFAAKRTDTAWVFHHRTEGLLIFRIYEPEEMMDEGDLRSSRKFLDMRGLLEANEFDMFVQEARAPA
jgi:hypothetical protein